MDNLTAPLTAEEHRNYQIIVGCLVLAGSLYWVFGGFWRSFVFFIAISMCGFFGIGTRWLLRTALVVLAVATLVAFDIVSHPTTWGKELKVLALGAPSAIACVSPREN